MPSEEKKTRSQRFHELMESISDESLDAIDAELEAERNDPNYQPKPVAWRDDPDPFGMDWKWAEPQDQDPPE
jgi:hypothetical protein